MLSSSCLKRPIEEVIFFSVFMNKTNLATVSLRAAKQKVLHMSCSHFIPMCVREGSVLAEKWVWSFIRFPVRGFEPKENVTFNFWTFISRGTSQFLQG